MDIYKAETREIIRRFFSGEISFPDCIAALDAAATGFIQSMPSDQFAELRSVMQTNNAEVMQEVSRRATRSTNPEDHQTIH